MSTFDVDDRDTKGYFLPESSQLRLQKLRDYAEFLSQIAQPRAPDAGQEGAPRINAEQVGICLEYLVEQMDLALRRISFPAYRAESDAAPASDETPYTAEAMPYDTGERYRFGITLDQIDTLNQLIDMIAAHGDVVTTSHASELADRTLSLLGHAIFNDARALRDIIDQIEAQRLDPSRYPPTGVGEAHAVYCIGRESSWETQILPRRWPGESHGMRVGECFNSDLTNTRPRKH